MAYVSFREGRINGLVHLLIWVVATQIFFGIFTPKLGEDEPILTHISQRGWNHQLVINGVYWGYNPLILTFDPNFQRDIQVGPFQSI